MSATAWAAWIALALNALLLATVAALAGYLTRAWRELAPTVLPIAQSFGFARQRAAVPPKPDRSVDPCSD